MIGQSSHLRYVVLCIFVSFLCLNLFGQDLDSLRQVWEDQSQTDANRLQALEQLSRHSFQMNELDSAQVFAQLLYEQALSSQSKSWMAKGLKIQGLIRKKTEDNPSEAIKLFEQSLQINRDISDRMEIASCLLEIGKLHYSQGAFDEAEQNLLDALNQYQAVNDYSGSQKSLDFLSHIYLNLGRGGKARFYLHQALADAEKKSHEQHLMTFLMLIGNSYQFSSSDSALLFFNKAEEKAEQLKDTAILIHLSGNKGIIYSDIGNYRQSALNYANSLRFAEHFHDHIGIISARLGLSTIQKQQGEFETAIMHAEQALRLAREIQDDGEIINSLNTIGIVYQAKDAYQQAIPFYQEAFDLAENYGNRFIFSKGIAKTNIANCYKEIGDFERALPTYQEALALSRTFQGGSFIAASLAGIGNIHFQRKEYALAIPICLEALEIAKEGVDFLQIRGPAKDLYLMYKEQGQIAKALDMHELLLTINDSIQNSENQRAVIHQQYQYEFEKQALADSLSFVQEKASTELSYQKQLANRNYLLFGGLGIALLGFVLFRYRQQIRNREKELELQQERERKEQLAELDAMKSRFFANISHEFRTPLTLILGQNEYLKSRIDDPALDKNFDMLHRNGRRLLGLVNQVLDLSKLESGKLKLQQLPANLIPFLKNLLFSFESLADQKKISLQFRSNTESLISLVDLEKMERVFFNLLSNAVKFTPEHGTISLLLDQHAATVRIGIQDTGVGIVQDQLAYVFDRFYQASSSEEQSSPGTGIGLALAKELVELHEGRLSVESEAGKGSTFWVELPLITHPHIEVNSYLLQLEPAEPTLPAPEFRESSARTEQILIVEDNPDVRSFLDQTLQGFGYKVIQAEDGQIGLKQAKKHQPDLIISDIMMPRMDGFDFARAIRADVKSSHIPLILLTAKASDESRIAGLETGVDAYLTKPFKAKELQVRIKNLIEQRKQLQQRFSTSLTIRPEEVSVIPMDQQFIQKVTTLIEENIGNPQFGVEMLSEGINMSITHLNRKLKALIGQSSGKLIRSMRLQRAADLLNQQSGTISDISYELGFSDPTHFARAFKKQFGRSPSAYVAERGRL
ncbi:MAG: tetratricopeptide repeat protein [Bacteroidota bacterium]